MNRALEGTKIALRKNIEILSIAKKKKIEIQDLFNIRQPWHLAEKKKHFRLILSKLKMQLQCFSMFITIEHLVSLP